MSGKETGSPYPRYEKVSTVFFIPLLRFLWKLKRCKIQKIKDNKKVPFFIYKGLKCTVGTPFHNAGKGQKRYLLNSKKTKIFVCCTVFTIQKGYQKVKNEDTKTVQKSPTDTVVGRVCSLSRTPSPDAARLRAARGSGPSPTAASPSSA